MCGLLSVNPLKAIVQLKDKGTNTIGASSRQLGVDNNLGKRNPVARRSRKITNEQAEAQAIIDAAPWRGSGQRPVGL